MRRIVRLSATTLDGHSSNPPPGPPSRDSCASRESCGESSSGSAAGPDLPVRFSPYTEPYPYPYPYPI